MRKRLSDNNLNLLDELVRFRLMSTAQVQRRAFPNATPEAAANVLRRLHAAQFVSRAWCPVVTNATLRHARPAACWYLTPANLRAIEDELAATERADRAEDFRQAFKESRHTEVFAANTIRHELAITDFYLDLEAAVPAAGAALRFWLRTSPRHPDVTTRLTATIRDRTTGESFSRAVPFNPDALHVIERAGRLELYFLEVDMNTETAQEKINNKFIAYLAYHQQRLFQTLRERLASRYGLRLPSDTGFRVLFVTTTRKRRNDLLLRAVPLPTQGLFHFAAMEDLRAAPLGRAWVSKADWKPHHDAYKRQAEALGDGALRLWAHARMDGLELQAL